MRQSATSVGYSTAQASRRLLDQQRIDRHEREVARARGCFLLSLGATIAFICAFVVIVSLSGCATSTEQIAGGTNDVRRLAHSSRDRFARIGEETTKPDPAIPVIADEAQAGMGEQDLIIKTTDRIYLALTGVDNRSPAWFGVVVWICAALSIIGGCWFLWYCGVGRLLRGVLGLVTPADRKRAELAASLMDVNDPQVRERIMQLRLDDPRFDRAFRQVAPINAVPRPATTGDTP